MVSINKVDTPAAFETEAAKSDPFVNKLRFCLDQFNKSVKNWNKYQDPLQAIEAKNWCLKFADYADKDKDHECAGDATNAFHEVGDRSKEMGQPAIR